MPAVGPEAAAPTKPTPPKDLINLRNLKNGEVYRFSCRTCIDGHRAPLCDPKKHRGKIMYRRPNPGRPARQCGHPKSVQCDCLAKRTLCCILSSDEWDQVTDGKVVTVAMYDSMEDLEAAQGKLRSADALANTATPSSGHPYGAFAGTSSPQPSRFQIFGVGGPQGHVESMTDPFVWSGAAPAIQPHHHRMSVEAPSPGGMHNMHSYAPSPPSHAEHSRPLSQAQSQFGQFQVSMAPAQTPGSISSGPYSSYTATTPGSTTGYSIDDPSTPMDARVISLQQRLSTNLDLSHMTHAIAPHFANGAPRTLSIDPNNFSPPILGSESMHLEMSMPTLMQSMPATKSQPSQSCCSKKSEPTQHMQMFDSYMYPGSAPLQQFPCPSCASTLCTCSNCPSTMQSFEFGGAWAQACGRTGHLESPYTPVPSYAFPTHDLPQTPSSIPHNTQAAPQPQGSCCASNRQSFHQPVDSFAHVQAPASNDWPSGQQFGGPYTPTGESVDPRTLHSALLHEDPMIWQ
ncbi:hypothetical protein CAC42_115 [Sphaceloma murrayae]|uniref:Copper-fist domain-containing protein n=1 Tax=Sphaceloma murrayae TaxID=2082308 RepID=A0A2K1QN05_9PEZI|nr:hypothetical protein CAC42_115 [Sphaceloma murrayae]